MIDCDDFEDISTLRVSCIGKVSLQVVHNCLFPGRDGLAGPQQLGVVGQALQDWGQDCVQAGAVDAPPPLLHRDPCGDSHAAADQQVARAAGADHLRLPGHQRQPDGHHLQRRRHRRASPRGGWRLGNNLQKGLFILILFEGCHELGDAADLPNLDDGATHHHGPAETGRGYHGGEDH